MTAPASAPMPELTPAEAHARQRAGARLVDVREDEERALGMAEGAVGVPRAALEADPASTLPDRDAEVLLVCAAGQRSLRAAEALRAAGYTRLASVRGGMAAWMAAGLPLQAGPEDADFLDRYSRHLRLPGVGLDGQRRLASATVLMVGAGGLGAPAALYLAAAGVGTLRLVDDDVVERSNLQRQVIHREDAIGTPKVASAAAAIAALNPRVRVEPVQARLSSANVDALLRGVDVVLDGADNFPARYLLSDACLKHGLPLVHGAVQRFAGQVAVFDPAHARGVAPCYRCLFPQPPGPGEAPNCAEAGVLGVLPGLVGLLQANEVLKLLLGIGEPLRGRLLQVDGLGPRFRELRLPADPDCPACAPGRPAPGYIDYHAFCAAG
jgi:molybdopterin/thiamine biosynthesis adenylyltransferase/rhodanese-related sulfurtransferase